MSQQTSQQILEKKYNQQSYNQLSKLARYQITTKKLEFVFLTVLMGLQIVGFNNQAFAGPSNVSAPTISGRCSLFGDIDGDKRYESHVGSAFLTSKIEKEVVGKDGLKVERKAAYCPDPAGLSCVDLSKNQFIIGTNHQIFYPKGKLSDDAPVYGTFKTLQVKCGKVTFLVNRNKTYSRKLEGEAAKVPGVIRNGFDLAVFNIVASSIKGGSIEEIQGLNPLSDFNDEADVGQRLHFGTSAVIGDRIADSHGCVVASVHYGSFGVHCDTLPEGLDSGTFGVTDKEDRSGKVHRDRLKKPYVRGIVTKYIESYTGNGFDIIMESVLFRKDFRREAALVTAEADAQLK
jgi:hypothetical protein